MYGCRVQLSELLTTVKCWSESKSVSRKAVLQKCSSDKLYSIAMNLLLEISRKFQLRKHLLSSLELVLSKCLNSRLVNTKAGKNITVTGFPFLDFMHSNQ